MSEEEKIEATQGVNGELTYTGKFKHGMKVGKHTHMDFELRQMTTADMLDAELEVSTVAQMNFKLQLAMRQLVRVGTFHGPFSIKMIKTLEPVDFHTLTDGLSKVAKLGEAESQEEEST